MRSSTTPPDASSQQSVYCACPGRMRSRSLLSVALTKAAAPAPRTLALPRCETSKTPTASRTPACSFNTPPPDAVYSMGISQPPKSASLAPRATWRSCSGEWRRSVMAATYLRRADVRALSPRPFVIHSQAGRVPGGLLNHVASAPETHRSPTILEPRVTTLTLSATPTAEL